MTFNTFNGSVLNPEQTSFELKALSETVFGTGNEYMLTVSTIGLLDIWPHHVTLIGKTLVEPESMSHLFFFPSFSPEISTSYFSLGMKKMNTHLFSALSDLSYPLSH